MQYDMHINVCDLIKTLTGRHNMEKSICIPEEGGNRGG